MLDTPVICEKGSGSQSEEGYSPAAAASNSIASTYRLLFLVILLKPLSNLVFAVGLKSAPEVLSIYPWAYIRSMIEPMVALGIALQIFWLLSRMALLSRADLSFVLPATACGYAITALLAKFFLAEQITPKHWLGIVLICLGSGFVGFTRQNTTAQNST